MQGKRWLCIATALISLLFFGCSQAPQLAKFNTLLYDDTYKSAMLYAKKRAKKSTLWSIQGGAAALYAGMPVKSNALLQNASLRMKLGEVISTGALGSLRHEVLHAGTLGIYTGHWYEASVIKLYEGLNHLALGDKSSAGVALKSAMDIQGHAAYEFIKLINKAKAKLDEKLDADRQKAHNRVKKMMSLEEQQEIDGFSITLSDKDSASGILATYIKEKYPNFNSLDDKDSVQKRAKLLKGNPILKDYKDLVELGIASAPFINPEIPYIYALYLAIANGDRASIADARGILAKGVAAPLFFMDDSFAMVSRDYEILKDMASKQGAPKYTWVIIEEGQSPTLSQYIKNINLLTLDLSVSLPRFMPGQPLSKLSVDGMPLVVLSDYNMLVGNEYERLEGSMVAKQAALTVTKALVQLTVTAMAAKAGGGAGAIISSLIMGMISKAIVIPLNTDLASALPYRTYVVRTANKPLSIDQDGTPYVRIDFCSDCSVKSAPNSLVLRSDEYNLVFIRSTKNKSKNSVQLLLHRK